MHSLPTDFLAKAQRCRVTCLRPHSQDRVQLGFEHRLSDKKGFHKLPWTPVPAHPSTGSSPRNRPLPGEGGSSQQQPHPVTVVWGVPALSPPLGQGNRKQPCSALQSTIHSPAATPPALGGLRGDLPPSPHPEEGSWALATAAGLTRQRLGWWTIPLESSARPPPPPPALPPAPPGPGINFFSRQL